jgi:SAM-dependent methyltransferase
MVTMDPLYIVDHDQELLTPFLSQFNELYQRRLRPYLIKDDDTNSLLYQLPDNQFGLVLAYNFFNYKPLPVLEKYFAELYHKLRPGGRAIFTYNDCEVAQNMGLNERCFMMYQPWRLLRPMLEKFGFEIHSINRDAGDMTWAEIGKSGTVTSIRGAQTLAKIVAM